MLIPLCPNRLKEIVSVGLANYYLGFAYLLERSISIGEAPPLRLLDQSVLYCAEQKSVELVLDRCKLLDEYHIRRTCMLIYFYENDPHAFRLDGVSPEFDVPRVHIRTHEEVLILLRDGRSAFVLPSSLSLESVSR